MIVAFPLPTINTADWDKSVIILNDKFQITAANKGGQGLLDSLCMMEQIDKNVLPRPIRAVCTIAKALISDEGELTEAKICIHPSTREFFTIHATILQTDELQFAVTCHKTAPQEILNTTAAF